jgi:hypothetical protein
MANVTPPLINLDHPRDKIFEGIPAESPEFTMLRRGVIGIITLSLTGEKPYRKMERV